MARSSVVQAKRGKRGQGTKPPTKASSKRVKQTEPTARGRPTRTASHTTRAKLPSNLKPARATSTVGERLRRTMPAPRCELEHENAWQLLVATILSAQSTDKMVNAVTPGLFSRWPTPRALAEALQEQVEEVVRRTGFYRNKAKAIRAASRSIVDEFAGEVPRTMDEMLTLPGVARKTANVVLGTAFGIAEGVVVDTHALRVSHRLGLTAHEDPPGVEQDLLVHFPRREWIDLGHRLVLHGRYVCLARAPRCAACPLNETCPSRQAKPEGSWQERAERERRFVEARGAGTL